MKDKVQHIKQKFSNNRKVAENYFFMTFLNSANLVISLLFFPYLIRTLGKEAYGMYVFILSNIQFFLIFVNFGFNYPALKKISLHSTDNKIKSQTLSEVFTAKIYLLVLCTLVFLVLVFSVPFVRTNLVFYAVIFTSLSICILSPAWYFQGIQKMKFVTYLNLTVRILTIPLILIFVKSPADLLNFTLIITPLPVLGGVFTFFYLQIKEKAQIRFIPFTSLKPVFTDAMPFFWTSAFGTFKQESVTLIIGTFFSMGSVALWDLANKIISIPRMITNSINSALFPKVVKNHNSESVKKIIRYESFIGLAISLLITVFGYWAVLVLGGKEMLAAYPLAVILSFTIYTGLVVGCYVNFVFIPHNHYYFVTKNQLVSFVSFLLLSAIGLLISKNIIALVSAFALSHLVEIIYCRYLTKKHKLLC